MRISKMTVMVMEHLSHIQWKDPHELADEMKINIFALGGLLVSLRELQKHKLAEARERDEPPEILIGRGGRTRLEWRLTETGLRVRARLGDAQEHGDTLLLPSLT